MTSTQTTQSTTTTYQSYPPASAPGTYTTDPYAPGYRPVGRLPIGVAVIAVRIGSVGFFFLLLGILGLVGVALFAHYGVIGSVGFLGALLTLLFGVVLLVVASGLWNQELWALALSILVLVILLAWNLYDLFYGGAVNVLFMAIEAILLVYLIAVSPHFD
jgi:hypothetical protein